MGSEQRCEASDRVKRRTFLQSLAAIFAAPRVLEQLQELKPCPTCGTPDHEVWMGFVECFDCHANRKPPADYSWEVKYTDVPNGRFDGIKLAHYRNGEFLGLVDAPWPPLNGLHS